jgi:hypothetical protein
MKHESDRVPELPLRTTETFKIETLSTFSAINVERYLTALDSSKSAGPDRVEACVLIKCAKSLSKPISEIFIKSYRDRDLPDSWKTANVSPIHKGGSKVEMSNYRLVSLTSIVGKVMERMLRDEILNYLLLNKLINEKQHEFMPGKSCTTNLLEFIDRVTYEIEHENLVQVIYSGLAIIRDNFLGGQKGGSD